MRFPWMKAETRAAASYTDAVVSAIVARATEGIPLTCFRLAQSRPRPHW